MAKSPMISPIMIERLGIRHEYLSMEQGNQTRMKDGYPGNRKLLSQEQASQMSQNVVVRLLINAGFESSSDSTLESMEQFLSCLITKLGRTIELFAYSYRKQCSAIELLKMFLRTAGYSNLGTLMELTKVNSKNVVQQTQQQMVGHPGTVAITTAAVCSTDTADYKTNDPQMQNNPQYLAFQQQQWERMGWRQQSTTPRPDTDTNTKGQTSSAS